MCVVCEFVVCLCACVCLHVCVHERTFMSLILVFLDVTY